jgi:hypothetical protein
MGANRMVAVRMGVGPTIMLHGGAWFDFCAPGESAFTIEDIAHGLANICRYSGQCNSFYSVAEHSLLVSEVAKGFEFEALLHDAAEAFLPTEVKEADLRVLAAEQRQIMPKGTDGWVRGRKVVPADVVVRHFPPGEAKRTFLARFEALRPRYHLRRSVRSTQGFSGVNGVGKI